MTAPPRPPPLGRPFWTLVAASGLSNAADGVFKVALPLVALRFTTSPGLIAGLEIVRTAPWLLLALQAGALTDRWDRRRTMLAANAVRGLAVAVPGVAALVGEGSLALLYVSALVMGVAEVLHDTAAQSILPAVVGRRQLERANSRLYAVELGTQQFLGPPLAGLLVGAAAAVALLAPSVLWAVALLALATVRGSFRPAPRTERTSIRQDVAEGVRFLRGHQMLRTLAVMVGGMNLTTSAAFPLFVVFAVGPSSTLGLTDAQFGLLSIAIAAGSLLATVVAAPLQRRLGRTRLLTVTVIAAAAFVGAPALTTSVWAIGVLLFVGGFGIMLWNIPTVSFRQTVTPDHLLGRVNSAYRLLAWGTMPVGAGIGGLLGEVVGVRPTFAVAGLAALLLLVPLRWVSDERLAAAEAAAEHDRQAGSAPVPPTPGPEAP